MAGLTFLASPNALAWRGVVWRGLAVGIRGLIGCGARPISLQSATLAHGAAEMAR